MTIADTMIADHRPPRRRISRPCRAGPSLDRAPDLPV